MQQRTPFLVKRDVIAQLFTSDRDQLPAGVCWTPELGNLQIKDYMELNGQLLPPVCLRPLSRHTLPATQAQDLDETQPFRLLARCRIMFTSGAKAFQVEHCAS